MTTINDLRNFKPKFDYFIALDSDGTIFDSMSFKHKNCFLEPLINEFDLDSAEKEVISFWKFINLNSKNRGINRFEALYLLFKNLDKISKIKLSKIKLSEIIVLKKLLSMHNSPSNDDLISFLKNLKKKEEEDFISKAISWSNKVNEQVKIKCSNIPIFDNVLKSLKLISKYTDVMVISNTPYSTLLREWKKNKIYQFVSLIGSQETGDKSEMFKAATNGKYDRYKTLMIGDSPSDLVAAKENKSFFYPIIPSSEQMSWKFFKDVAFEKFLVKDDFNFIEKEKISEFQRRLKFNI